MALAAVNSKLLIETSPPKPVHPSPSPSELGLGSKEGEIVHKNQNYRVLRGMKDSFGVSMTAWKKLWKGPALRNVVLLNGSFWFVYSGAQMTLLPILLVSPELHLSAPEIGGTFAVMSMISFLASQPCAYLADKYGKIPGLLVGCSLIGVSGFLLIALINK